MDAAVIIAYIEKMIEVGTESVTAWNATVKVVNEKRDPTPEEWAALDRQADDAHAGVQNA